MEGVLHAWKASKRLTRRVLHEIFPDDADLRVSGEAADKHGSRVSFTLQNISVINAFINEHILRFVEIANDMFKNNSFDGINFV